MKIVNHRSKCGCAYLALMARILPYYVNADIPEDILTREETLAELKLRGLPLELIEHLRRAPTRLDEDESDDPWNLRKKGVTLDMGPAPGDTENK